MILTGIPLCMHQLKLIWFTHEEISNLSSNLSNHTKKMIDTARLAIESNYMRSSKLNLSILKISLRIDILKNTLQFCRAKVKRG